MYKNKNEKSRRYEITVEWLKNCSHFDVLNFSKKQPYTQSAIVYAPARKGGARQSNKDSACYGVVYEGHYNFPSELIRDLFDILGLPD